MPAVLWFRRDLRRRDHPALLAAADTAGGGRLTPLFVLDPALWEPAGPVRRAWLLRSLRELRASLGGVLHVRYGDPVRVLPEVAAATDASTVHISADFGPYGTRRDEQVSRALGTAGVELVRTGSPYAVSPGRIRKSDGTPYRVFTPFLRAWTDHGWRAPADAPRDEPDWWSPRGSERLPALPDLGALELPAVGEDAALARWAAFREQGLDTYDERRDRPGLEGTSGLSAHLRWGEIHPRTLLADLGRSRAHGVFRSELAWREFYADVLAREPGSARENLDRRFDAMPWDSGGSAAEHLAAWQAGRTGFPFVDAGMRQLRAEGWMHNRVRMVTASFLVKDLHLPWRDGARWFMTWLRDGDLASNQHGWQWVAGSGTDAAPYFRVFNPVAQGLRFDPDGDYVRRYVPELRALGGPAAHEPWKSGGAPGYPEPIVDHGAERLDALARYDRIRRAGTAR